MPRYASTATRSGFDLVCFGSGGVERGDDPDGRMSDVVLRTLSADESGITDVFLINHGWMSDMQAARQQYGLWVETMSGCEADIERVKRVRPGFKPHFVGIHWPSMPWGDESFRDDGSFSVPTDGNPLTDPVESIIDDYASRIADTPLARDAIRRIVSAAIENVEPDTLPPDVVSAYRQLNVESELGIGGVGAGPGGDRSSFAPEEIYQSLRDDAPSFGLGSGGVLGVLRTLSFWRMKDRARWFGETVGATFLARMMQAAPRGLRFHLMGQGFGCIVMSAALAGPKGRGHLARPVESLALLQGALSLWSYCDDIPATPGQPGYFSKVITAGRVCGSIIATQSVFDTANGKWYPLGAGVAGQVTFAAPGELPKYGAVGTHGIRGPGVKSIDMPIQSDGKEYGFEPGNVYNLECSDVIREGTGRSGAHSDIYHPELAHAVWQAALSSR